MIKISGYIILQDTKEGIPNLVVAAYDSAQPLHEIIKEHRNEKGFSPSLMHYLGNSISSVLTDSNGLFLINTEDLKFEGNKSRPDLVIVVFAPEDIQDVNNPVPLSPNERILYLSAMPRNEAGAEEAYMIRILKAQLDKYNIPLTEGLSDLNKADALLATHFNTLDKSDYLQDKLKQRLQPRLTDQINKQTESKTKVKEILKNFSSIPHSLRNHPTLLKNPKDLNKIQNKVAKDGLSRISGFDNKVTIKLSKKDLEDLGAKINEKGEVTGTIDTLALTKKMKDRTDGVDLVRRKEILPSSITPENLYKKYFLNKKDDESKKKNDNNSDSDQEYIEE